MSKQVLFALIVAVSILLGYATVRAGATKSTSNVELQVSNPYRMSVKVEVKCDWDPDMEQYALHRFVEVKRKQLTTIVIPNNLKKCELWPEIIW